VVPDIPIEIVKDIPIEIVNVILRHSNLATIQQYLRKVSDVEALRWIENSYA
jgi:hypothetical protein